MINDKGTIALATRPVSLASRNVANFISKKRPTSWNGPYKLANTIAIEGSLKFELKNWINDNAVVEKIKYSVNPKIIKTVIMTFSFLDNLKGTRSIIGFLASFFFSSFLKFKFIKKYTAIRNKDNDRSKNIESSPK